MRNRNRRRFLFLTLAAILVGGPAPACQVPVFRYALERWIPDAYRLESAGPEAASLAENKHTNISVNPSPGANKSVLRFPEISGIDKPFWTAASTKELSAIPDSPLRREITQRILKGDSAVWVLIESGDPEKDGNALSTLRSALRKAEETLEIPEGVVGVEEAKRRDLAPEEEENVLVSSIPLKIQFSILRLSRQNRDEAVLLSLLTHMEDDLGDYADEPMTFALFGRGRVLPPLVAGGITIDNVLGDCGYLCGACSCQVKRENPGIDALFTADWDAALQGETFVVDKTLPPLSGAGDLTEADIPTPENPTPIAPPPTVADASETSTFRYTLPIAFGLAVLVILFGSLRILKRS